MPPHLLSPVMHTLPSFFLTNTCLLSFLVCVGPTAQRTETPDRQAGRQVDRQTDRLTWAPAVRSAQCVRWWWTPLSYRLSASCRSNLYWQPSLWERRGKGCIKRAGAGLRAQIDQKLKISLIMSEKSDLLLQSDWQEKNQFARGTLIKASYTQKITVVLLFLPEFP